MDQRTEKVATRAGSGPSLEPIEAYRVQSDTCSDATLRMLTVRGSGSILVNLPLVTFSTWTGRTDSSGAYSLDKQYMYALSQKAYKEDSPVFRRTRRPESYQTGDYAQDYTALRSSKRATESATPPMERMAVTYRYAMSSLEMTYWHVNHVRYDELRTHAHVEIRFLEGVYDQVKAKSIRSIDVPTASVRLAYFALIHIVHYMRRTSNTGFRIPKRIKDMVAEILIYGK